MNEFITRLPELKIDIEDLRKILDEDFGWTPAYGVKFPQSDINGLSGRFEKFDISVIKHESILKITNQLSIQPEHAFFLRTYAGKTSNIHTDLNRKVGINIPLENYEGKSRLIFYGVEGFPVMEWPGIDTVATLVNVGKYHATLNKGTRDRIVLSLSFFNHTYEELRELHASGKFIVPKI